jgi:hypothetical protein
MNPSAALVFADHAAINVALTKKATYFYLGYNCVTFPQMYAPLYTGVILLVALAWGTVQWLFTWKREGMAWLQRSESLGWTLAVVMGAMQLALCQLTYNGYYMALIVPWAVLSLFLGGPASWMKKPQPAVMVALVLVVIFHGAYLGARLWQWKKQGLVNYRTALHRFYVSIPGQGMVVVPEVLWEEALASPRPALLNTLPQNTTPPMRMAYRQFLAEHETSIECLVTDRLQTQISQIEIDSGWRKTKVLDLTWLRERNRRGFFIEEWEKIKP